MSAIVHQPRHLEPWQLIIAAGIILTAAFLFAFLAAVAFGVVWVIAHGVGYLLTHAWWAR